MLYSPKRRARGAKTYKVANSVNPNAAVALNRAEAEGHATLGNKLLELILGMQAENKSVRHMGPCCRSNKAAQLARAVIVCGLGGCWVFQACIQSVHSMQGH